MCNAVHICTCTCTSTLYTVKHEIFACMLFLLHPRFGKIRENFMQLNVPKSVRLLPRDLAAANVIAWSQIIILIIILKFPVGSLALYIKAFLYKKVLSFFLKSRRFVIARIFDGKLFHTLGPAIIKALSPLTMFDFGTWSGLAPVDRSV